MSGLEIFGITVALTWLIFWWNVVISLKGAYMAKQWSSIVDKGMIGLNKIIEDIKEEIK